MTTINLTSGSMTLQALTSTGTLTFVRNISDSNMAVGTLTMFGRFLEEENPFPPIGLGMGLEMTGNQKPRG